MLALRHDRGERNLVPRHEDRLLALCKRATLRHPVDDPVADRARRDHPIDQHHDIAMRLCAGCDHCSHTLNDYRECLDRQLVARPRANRHQTALLVIDVHIQTVSLLPAEDALLPAPLVDLCLVRQHAKRVAEFANRALHCLVDRRVRDARAQILPDDALEELGRLRREKGHQPLHLVAGLIARQRALAVFALGQLFEALPDGRVFERVRARRRDFDAFGNLTHAVADERVERCDADALERVEREELFDESLLASPAWLFWA